MMFLIQVVTGGKMSLGEGDIYRRACEHAGKGKQDAKDTLARMEGEMRAMSPYPSAIVDQVTTLIKGGANYAFNKSHSLSYSLFSYAQAWFKHHYPHIFFASHITLLAAKNKLDKAHKIINNARTCGIEIKPPHLKHSGYETTWSKDKRTIYLPFTVMKGVKDGVSSALSRIGKQVNNLEDALVACVRDEDVKKNHLVSMSKVGALDDLGHPRLRVLAMVSYVCATTTPKSSEALIRAKCKDVEGFIIAGQPSRERQSLAEVKVFGGFISSCPIDPWVEPRLGDNGWMDANGWTALSRIEPEPEQRFRVYFMITSIVKKVHKSGNSKGKEWLKLICWDGVAVCELSVWAFDLDGSDDGMAGYRDLIMPNRVYCAEVQSDGERPVTLARRSSRSPGETLWLKPKTI
jgi:DNA polymerase III alpha subunit